MTETQPDIRASLPAAMVEAAARAHWEWSEGEVPRHERWHHLQEGSREFQRDIARVVLAAALAECEGRTEERLVQPDGTVGPWRLPWAPLTPTRRRLVITTPPEDVAVVVTPAQAKGAQ